MHNYIVFYYYTNYTYFCILGNGIVIQNMLRYHKISYFLRKITKGLSQILLTYSIYWFQHMQSRPSSCSSISLSKTPYFLNKKCPSFLPRAAYNKLIILCDTTFGAPLKLFAIRMRTSLKVFFLKGNLNIITKTSNWWVSSLSLL